MHLILSLLLAWLPPVLGAADPPLPPGRRSLRARPAPRRRLPGSRRGPVGLLRPGRVRGPGRGRGDGERALRALARVLRAARARRGAGGRAGRARRVARPHGARAIHFGVRREGRRFGYVDPLRFLGARPAPPPLAAPPPSGAPRGGGRPSFPARPHPPPRPVAARSHPPPALAPWPVWLGLLLGLTGLLGAGRLRLPYRRQEGATCRASSTSSSSPTIPSSR